MFGRIMRSGTKARYMGALAMGGTTVVALGSAVTLHAAETSVDEAAVRKEVSNLLMDNEPMGPTLVRLAWHAAGTFDKATGVGGSNGATMRFSQEAGHGANAGLGVARDFLEPVKAKFPALR
jgi:cytochrome c peroxidase